MKREFSVVRQSLALATWRNTRLATRSGANTRGRGGPSARRDRSWRQRRNTQVACWADRLRCSYYWAYGADCLMGPALYPDLSGGTHLQLNFVASHIEACGNI